ncbi:hypothetical protein JTE90_025162 [Oedothorax gibbosus]|uniref:peptide-methionine (S)-S-oxide reductase n=1 Tax=Oedothorax gibbosus TaxID=931172 RepID=A0AAV6UIZ7_9ARAC|nr:hypothetical protein JTE90_025162 [Oedothorax gibbosus]
MKTATFAMGCFWHPDAMFGCQKGVYRTRVGYTSGSSTNPTYRNLSDHTEATEIDYDPTAITYVDLLKLYWKHQDPSVAHKRQYRMAIFYREEEEKDVATDMKKEIETKVGRQVSTSIEPFTKFYNAEDYHQKYYLQTHHVKVFKSLGIKQNELRDSPVAAKLNGYVVGENTIESFEEIVGLLGLSPESAEYVRKMIAKGKSAHC